MTTKRCCSLEDMPITMSVREVAEIIGIDKDTVYELIHMGRLDSIRVGRRILVTKMAVARFLEAT